MIKGCTGSYGLYTLSTPVNMPPARYNTGPMVILIQHSKSVEQASICSNSLRDNRYSILLLRYATSGEVHGRRHRTQPPIPENSKGRRDARLT